MRVFYLITELDPGGAERALCRLATTLDRTRFEPAVGCLTGRGEMGRALAEAGIEVVYFDMRGAGDFGVVRRVAKELRRRQPDILHSFLFHANLVGRLAARFGGRPKVISSVRVEEPRQWHLRLDRWTQRWVDVEACVSESARRFTAERAGIAPEKLTVIPNGIDPAPFDDPRPAPAAWGLPAEGPLVATVGRLAEQKDPLTLLRAFAAARAKAPDATLAWAGDGPLAAAAQAEAARLGITGAVRFLGRVDDPRPLYARADVFALASRWEGMPNVVLEAMAARRPVVATNVGGCSEIVREGETGFLVPPGDPGALGARLAQLLGDAPLRQRLGAAGRRLLEDRFTTAATTKQWEALYQRLAGDC